MPLGEFDIIARYFRRSSTRGDVLLGIGDDAAILQVPADRRLVAAVDTIVEDVHFPRGTSAYDIGYRALAVNLSDIAAMGAEPAWFTLSLSMPSSDEQWIAEFAQGLFQLADLHSIELVGGDTVKGPLVVSVQIFGLIETDAWLTRAGGKPGDLIFISGTPGDAAAGLALIQHKVESKALNATSTLMQRFLRPEPRVSLGRRLRTLASAAQDVSDGLLTDLSKLCSASGCGAHVDLDSLPVSSAMKLSFERSVRERFILNGGDDYELLFTVPKEKVIDMQATVQDDINCSCIGHLVQGADVRCYRNAVEEYVPLLGFDHFSVSGTESSK